MYILLHIKKHYFIHFCYLFLKLLKAFSVSFSKLIDVAKNDVVKKDIYNAMINKC